MISLILDAWAGNFSMPKKKKKSTSNKGKLARRKSAVRHSTSGKLPKKLVADLREMD